MSGGLLSTSTVWIVFIGYFLFLMLVAVYATRREKRQAGKVDLNSGKFKWPVLVMTYIASCMSVWVFFAGPGAYYRYGLGYFFSEMCIFSMFPIICYFTMTKVWIVNQQKHFTTPADFFFCRYKSNTLTLIIDIVYIVCAVPFITAVLVAAGRAAEIATGGALSAATFTLVAGLMMTIFVMFGGCKSTAFADAIQGWFFILALWAIIVAVLKIVFGGSLGEAFRTVLETTPEWFSYPGPIGVCSYPSRVSYPLACAFGFTLLLPQVFVRSGYYSAGLKDQRQTAFLAPFLQIIVWGGTMLIGLVALAAMPDLTSTDTELVIPLMCNIIAGSHGLLAQVLMILFLIGVLAVGLSTANSLLMVMSTIIYKDLLIGLGSCRIKRENLTVRIIIAIFGAVCIFVSLMNWEFVFNLMIFADSLVECLFPALVFGIYSKKATTKAAIVSVAAGAIVCCMTFFWWGLGYVWYGTIGLVVSLALMWGISKVTTDDPAKSADFFEALDSGHKRFMYINAKIKG